MKKIIENLGVAIFGCEITDTLDRVAPNPWKCVSGSRDEWARVYSWSPNNGFVDITDSPLIPKHEHMPNPWRDTKPIAIPLFYTKELKLPKGNYLILFHVDSGSWDRERCKALLGRVLQIEE